MKWQELFLTLATVVLAILAGWYSWETRKLRKSTESQFKEQKRQHEINLESLRRRDRLSTAPYILPSKEITVESFLKDPSLTSSNPQKVDFVFWRHIFAEKAIKLNRLIQLDNPGKTAAVDVAFFVYLEGYLMGSPKIVYFFKPGASHLFPLIEINRSEEEAIYFISKYYNNQIAEHLASEHLSPRRNFAAAIFCDPEDHVYINKLFLRTNKTAIIQSFFGRRHYLGRRSHDTEAEITFDLLFEKDNTRDK